MAGSCEHTASSMKKLRSLVYFPIQVSPRSLSRHEPGPLLGDVECTCLLRLACFPRKAAVRLTAVLKCRRNPSFDALSVNSRSQSSVSREPVQFQYLFSPSHCASCNLSPAKRTAIAYILILNRQRAAQVTSLPEDPRIAYTLAVIWKVSNPSTQDDSKSAVA